MSAGHGKDRGAIFDTLYTQDADPWNFTTTEYERKKYDATLAALPPGRFAHVLEIGCAFGLMSERLVERCEQLTGIDVSQVAIGRAQSLQLPGACFLCAEIPAGWPEGTFDLILLSEILYFLKAAEVEETARRVIDGLARRGTCLLVNWTGENDCALDGNEAAELFLSCFEMAGFATHRLAGDSRYRIDRVFHRPDLARAPSL